MNRVPSQEVRIERRANFRRRLLLVVWLGAAGFILWRAGSLQVGEVEFWRAEADRQHRTQAEVPAPRGSIRDRNGLALAVSFERFRVSVAPQEIAGASGGREELQEILTEILDLAPGEAERIVSSERRWVVIPGRYPPHVREALSGVQGIYVERELTRSYPHDGLARAVLGSVVDGRGRDGVEQAFEERLRGEPGLEVKARDSRGRAIPGEVWTVRPARSGGDVVLTLDLDLQEIVREALREAVEETGAAGGDLLVTDPRSGEVLAMVSLSADGSTDLSSLHAPYEPGSTLKPFTVAALLSRGLASMGDSVDTEDGRWTTQGRTISDVQRVGTVTLERALQVSSNVGIAKLAERLSPEAQYEALRDFGFGVATGVGIPGEAAGILRRPRQWSRQSQASLAIGYEIGVTPLQMAMAYGALANGGLLMEPQLFRELRSPEGSVTDRFEPRAIRRVVPEDVAREVNRALVGAVEEGTGSRARLTTFSVAGKSGTSRAHGGAGGYATGGYYASFVGYFPADDPQLLVFVKLDRPQGEYYGGATAAPVTRATMEAVLASRRAPIDRGSLARLERRVVQEPSLSEMSSAPPAVTLASGALDPWEAGTASSPTTAGATSGTSTVGEERSPDTRAAVSVPEVAGLSLRAAVRRLHAHGLRVRWPEGGGVPCCRTGVDGTVPAAGETVSRGDTVQIRWLARPEGGGGGSPPGDERNE